MRLSGWLLNPGDHVAEIDERIDVVELAGFNHRRDDTVRAGKQSVLQFNAIGRILRSTTLEWISIRPSSRKRVRPFQRDSA
jgi:hypothetical protein